MQTQIQQAVADLGINLEDYGRKGKGPTRNKGKGKGKRPERNKGYQSDMYRNQAEEEEDTDEDFKPKGGKGSWRKGSNYWDIGPALLGTLVKAPVRIGMTTAAQQAAGSTTEALRIAQTSGGRRATSLTTTQGLMTWLRTLRAAAEKTIASRRVATRVSVAEAWMTLRSFFLVRSVWL